MKIYNYHPVTKEFLAESTADIDQLESKKQGTNIYLIPANATTAEPPACGNNQTAVFENDTWVVKPDFRGKEGWSTITREPAMVCFIGEVPEWFTDVEPRPLLEELKQQKEAEIILDYKNSFLNGLETSVNVKVSVTEGDQYNYVGIRLAVAGLNDEDVIPISLTDTAGVFHSLTKAQFNTIYIEVLNYKFHQDAKKINLLAQIIAVTAVEQLDLIKWNENLHEEGD